MKVHYNKGMGYPVEITNGETAVCISIDAAKELQASLLAVIEQAETPEEELTNFEEGLKVFLLDFVYTTVKEDAPEYIKKNSGVLLSLAREQFIKDGYVIEKKAFHDAVKKVSPEVMKEVSENVIVSSFIAALGNRYPEVSFAKLARIAKAAYDFGKAEALKNLPRWEKLINPTVIPVSLIKTWRGAYRIDNHIEPGNSFIPLSMLETLPGFKEEE